MKKWLLSGVCALLTVSVLALLSLAGCKNGGVSRDAGEAQVEEAVEGTVADAGVEQPPEAEAQPAEAPPPAETPAPRNSAPRSEPALVGVPGVNGAAYGDAAAILAGRGFQVGTAEAYSESVPAGCVISQNPPAGSSASPGSVVTVVVSLGSAWAACPSCGGAGSAVTEYTCPECGGTGWCYT